MAQPTISGYTLTDRLGSGGFASVYLATSDETGDQVAIKVLHDHASKPDDLRRFERERMTMRALSGHPNIVGVYDSGLTDDGSHFTALEYVEGGSVRDRIVADGALHWATAVEIGVQICAALDVAHRSGVLHRDVKPANILLDDDTAKLTDFGIARLVGQSQVTAAQSIIGTLAYTPPELFHNKPFDGRGDIYQLGISLYEMLLGRAPFTSAAADNKATIIRRILDNPAPPLAQFDVPQPLSDLLDEVLAKDPADRPQSAEALGRRLNEVEVQLGRTPTLIGEETQSIALETASMTAADDFTVAIAAPNDVGVDEPPSPPQAPIIAPPDADLTVAEPRPTNTTSVISSAPPETVTVPTQPPESEVDRRSPDGEEQSRSKRWPWVAAAAIVIAAAGAGVGAAQLVGDGTTSTGNTDNGGSDNDTGSTNDGPTEFVPLDDPAFAGIEAPEGVVFNTAQNPFGLTVVGAVGEGDSAAEQRPMAWTLGVNDLEDDEIFIRQRDFTATDGRLWSIGVIPGKAFLAVGEGADGSAAAFVGDVPSNFVAASSDSFDEQDARSLRAAVRDGTSDTFLVGGERVVDGQPSAAIWSVTNGSGDDENWGNLQWDAQPFPSQPSGIVNDVAVDRGTAVAVGSTGGGDDASATLMIRRDGTWMNLIEPTADATFWSVTIAGDRIIAVGALGSDPEPIAIVSDAAGNGWFHRLPLVDADQGIARAVTTLADGRVIAVGDVQGESDRDGALWDFFPDGTTASKTDEWKTRATADLQAEGFVELWTIDQFRDIVYVFGRTEDDDGRPAGIWTLDVRSE